MKKIVAAESTLIQKQQNKMAALRKKIDNELAEERMQRD
jgi:hypothetical protein